MMWQTLSEYHNVVAFRQPRDGGHREMAIDRGHAWLQFKTRSDGKDIFRVVLTPRNERDPAGRGNVTIGCKRIAAAERKLIHSRSGLQKSQVIIHAHTPISRERPVETFTLKFDREDYERFCMFFTIIMSAQLDDNGTSESWNIHIPDHLRRSWPRPNTFTP
jgi:hypothetical protein